jgi:transcriptional regulator GlxA family with amidase domain
MSENHLEKSDASASKMLPSSVPAFEKHFSVRELAQLWGLSERTIRRIFAGEAGVICWGRDESRSKRAYKTLRIPDSVAQRVYRKLRKAS